MPEEPAVGPESTEVEEQETAPAAVEPQEPEAPSSPWEDPAAAKKEIAKLRKESAEYRRKLRETEPLAKKAKDAEEAQKTEAERLTSQLDEANKQRTALTQRAARAEVKALAAEKFADPDDASAFLDLAAYVSDDGDIDADQIKTDLADLLKRKPHLAKPTEPRRPAPDRSQGSSGNHRSKSDPASEFAAFMGQKLAGR